jgi:hypothetical protein
VGHLRRTWFLLLLITILAGVLRFGWIDRPSVWGDEAATWSRVCGSYQEMLDTLRQAGFMPTHYQLTWWIAQGMPVAGQTTESGFVPSRRIVPGGIWLDPLALRFVPAFLGTLMPLAVFFVASQLLNRRIALAAALFAATSAYMLVYSRDAKMYMQFWFFATLHVGCLLWWLRAGYRPGDVAPGTTPRSMIERGLWETLRYASWIASGVTMVAFNALGLAIVAIELLILFTSREQRLRGFVTTPQAILMTLVAPVRLIWDRSGTVRGIRRAWDEACVPAILLFCVGAAAIAYVPRAYYSGFNQFDDRTRPDTPEDSADVDGMGIGWVALYNQGRAGVDYALYTASTYLFGWEWPTPANQSKMDPSILAALRTTTIVLVALLACGLVPWRSMLAYLVQTIRGRPFETPPALPPRSLFVLLAWLVVPAYVFYLASLPNASSPDQLLVSPLVHTPPASDFSPARAWVASALQAGTTIVPPALGWSKTGGAIVESLAPSNLRWWMVGVLAVLVLSLLLPPAGSKRQRLIKALGVLLSLAGVWALLWLAWLAVPTQEKSVWMPRYLGFVWPAFAILAAWLLDRLPLVPVRAAAVTLLVGANLGYFGLRVFGESEPPTRLMAVDAVSARDDARSIMFSAGSPGIGAPGTGRVRSVPMSYYASIVAREPTVPRTARGFDSMRRLNIEGIRPGDTQRIARRLRRDPGIVRVIIWHESAPDADAGDPYAAAFDDQWSVVKRERFAVHDHWMWLPLYDLHRTVWLRKPDGPD